MGAIQLAFPDYASWADRYAHHATTIRKSVKLASIEHIGSTSLGFIKAKDVVDIMVGVPAIDLQQTCDALSDLGYPQEGFRDSHSWHCWPSPDQRLVIVHVVEFQGKRWYERLLFRDALIAHRDIALQYEALKEESAERALNLSEYTSGKSAFVARVVKDASKSAPPAIKTLFGAAENGAISPSERWQTTKDLFLVEV